MPSAALRPCAGGCGARVPKGRCPSCSRQNRTGLTYAEGWWLTWRRTFREELISLGILPICGATMPDGPTLNPSRCRDQGLITGTSTKGTDLHFHHEPELTRAEALNKDAVCDKNRIVLLCDTCHNSETANAHRVGG